jgi:multisubunit Na+/H+ antiporter MnhB subunit
MLKFLYYVATSFTLAATAVPVVEVAVTTVIANPIMMIEIIEGAEAYYFGGKAPDGGLSGGIGTTMSYYKNNGETP